MTPSEQMILQCELRQVELTRAPAHSYFFTGDTGDTGAGTPTTLPLGLSSSLTAGERAEFDIELTPSLFFLDGEPSEKSYGERGILFGSGEDLYCAMPVSLFFLKLF